MDAECYRLAQCDPWLQRYGLETEGAGYAPLTMQMLVEMSLHEQDEARSLIDPCPKVRWLLYETPKFYRKAFLLT